MRRSITYVTLFCFVTTQTAALAGPHEEGIAAGQAANPAIQGSVNQQNASSVVPGYTTNPPEKTLFNQPNLAGKANAVLMNCALTPGDPVCEAKVSAMSSANTPRPAIGPYDPSVTGARNIANNPSTVLGSLSSYYAGCITNDVTTPGTMQPRLCHTYLGVGNLNCEKSLTVSVNRSTNCNPGDWFVHAGADNYGFDVQCRPGQAASAQHFRLTQAGDPLFYFDVNMGAPLIFPEMIKGLGTKHAPISNTDIPFGLWIVDNNCAGSSCSVTGLIAAEWAEVCTGNADSGFNCKTEVPFLKKYSACPGGTQSGDNIQSTTGNADDGYVTTSLDITKCYAPSKKKTSLGGIDITGAIEGSYWNFYSDRIVVGWKPNPAYGPIPTMSLSYVKPDSTVTTTDQWNDQCPALAAGGRCTPYTAATCVDGPGTKTIDGVNVWRSCWKYETTFSCQSGAPLDECAPLQAAGCTPAASNCKKVNAATGQCEVMENTFNCPVPASTTTTATNCPSNVFCLGSSCFNVNRPDDPDFARSMSFMEAIREAGVYIDTDRMQVFRGEQNNCRDRLLKNCCYSDSAGAGMSNHSLFGVGSRLVFDILMNSENRQFIYQGIQALLTSGGFSGSFTTYGVTVAVNGTALPAGSITLGTTDSLAIAVDPWSLAIVVIIYIIMSMSSCNEEEGKLAMQEGAHLCHTIGTWCSSCIKLFGKCVSCIEHTTSKCCFNSVLSRIINEQGRAQIGKGWGGAEHPDCSGFSIAQLQSLDFSTMDLTEFYASIVPTLPNVGGIQSTNAARLPNCYYGQGKC